MPGGDRTGPNGMGAMTGRAAGFCSGSGAPGFSNHFSRPNFGFGSGYGRGFGGGRGFGNGRDRRNMFYGDVASGFVPFVQAPGMYPYQTGEMESSSLKKYAEYLQVQLNSTNKRITDLESNKAD